jgi:ADP-ribose pyrophosphatase YjhB (NUDIX family)
LEYEESPLECLKREFIEELNQPIEVMEHFYTTDQFVRSAFRPWEQVISIYHWVELKGKQQFKTTTKRNDFNSDIDGDQESFRWEPISRLDPSDFSFLIDSHVVGLIKSYYRK